MYIVLRNEGVVLQKLLNTRWLHENIDSDHGLKIILPISPHRTTRVTWGVHFFDLFSQNQTIC